jgi:hypothetical protein
MGHVTTLELPCAVRHVSVLSIVLTCTQVSGLQLPTFSLGLSSTASVIRFGRRKYVLLFVDYAAWSSVLRSRQQH